jgi:hypothetical protein
MKSAEALPSAVEAPARRRARDRNHYDDARGLGIIRELRVRASDLVGAGTIRRFRRGRQSRPGGFHRLPGPRYGIIRACRRDIFVSAGGLTPTEIWRLEGQCDVVKVFRPLGQPKCFKDLKVRSRIRLLPTSESPRKTRPTSSGTERAGRLGTSL